MPRLIQIRLFLQQRKTGWGNASESLEWDKAESIQGLEYEFPELIRVPIIGRREWPTDLRHAAAVSGRSDVGYK
eukprot:5577931-Prorocentrum_lima.AAC.1